VPNQARFQGPAPHQAWAITVFCLVSFAVLAVVNVLAEQLDPARLLTCLISVGIVFVLQFYHCSPRARSWSTARKAWTLSVQAVFTYLPMVSFGLGWGGMAGCLAGSVLLAVAGRAAWILFGLISASMVVFPPLLSATLVQTVYVAMSTMLIGLVLYCLARLTDLVYEVHAARGDLARLAVAEERLRFARDLHDLLGYSLSAITLKSELVNRLASTRPERAREEIASILQISRQALADVRMVASGYRDLSLLDEVASATAILRAADIDVEVDAPDVGSVPPAVNTVLATALREGVTNLLRHSKVRRCSISVAITDGVVRLTLINDGVSDAPESGEHTGGSGLGNISVRLAGVGGCLQVGVRDDGLFRLVAEAPVERAAGGKPVLGPARAAA
jgi:two-component system sensor histidine kinase DesK